MVKYQLTRKESKQRLVYKSSNNYGSKNNIFVPFNSVVNTSKAKVYYNRVVGPFLLLNSLSSSVHISRKSLFF